VAAEQPAAAAEQPAAATEQPAAAAEQPAVATEQPAVAAEQPAVAAEQPAVAAEQPAVATEQPAVATEQPAVAAEQPAVAAEQPAVAAEQPAVAFSPPRPQHRVRLPHEQRGEYRGQQGGIERVPHEAVRLNRVSRGTEVQCQGRIPSPPNGGYQSSHRAPTGAAPRDVTHIRGHGQRFTFGRN
jgi:hypothetical protein